MFNTGLQGRGYTSAEQGIAESSQFSAIAL